MNVSKDITKPEYRRNDAAWLVASIVLLCFTWLMLFGWLALVVEGLHPNGSFLVVRDGVLQPVKVELLDVDGSLLDSKLWPSNTPMVAGVPIATPTTTTAATPAAPGTAGEAGSGQATATPCLSPAPSTLGAPDFVPGYVCGSGPQEGQKGQVVGRRLKDGTVLGVTVFYFNSDKGQEDASQPTS